MAIYAETKVYFACVIDYKFFIRHYLVFFFFFLMANIALLVASAINMHDIFLFLVTEIFAGDK